MKNESITLYIIHENRLSLFIGSQLKVSVCGRTIGELNHNSTTTQQQFRNIAKLAEVLSCMSRQKLFCFSFVVVWNFLMYWIPYTYLHLLILLITLSIHYGCFLIGVFFFYHCFVSRGGQCYHAASLYTHSLICTYIHAYLGATYLFILPYLLNFFFICWNTFCLVVMQFSCSMLAFYSFV